MSNKILPVLAILIWAGTYLPVSGQKVNWKARRPSPWPTRSTRPTTAQQGYSLSPRSVNSQSTYTSQSVGDRRESASGRTSSVTSEAAQQSGLTWLDPDPTHATDGLRVAQLGSDPSLSGDVSPGLPATDPLISSPLDSMGNEPVGPMMPAPMPPSPNGSATEFGPYDTGPPISGTLGGPPYPVAPGYPYNNAGCRSPFPGPPPSLGPRACAGSAATPAQAVPYLPLIPPYMVGGTMGTRPQVLTATSANSFHVRGTIISGSPGGLDAVLAYERDGGFPNDFTSVPGTGRDVTMDGFADTFEMAEPLPPNEVPTSPGSGFVYDGGTVVYTNSMAERTAQNGQFQNNDLWYASYSFSRTIEIPAGGALSVRRMHVAENNSPVPRDRLIFDYRYFKNALGSSTNNNWMTLGFEKTFWRGRFSLDTRLPFAYTFDNAQYLDDRGSRSRQLGNITSTFKLAICGNDRYILTGGTGVSAPTGEDTRLFLNDGTQILSIDNNSIHVQPFLAGVWMPKESFFLQSFASVDFDLADNEVRGSLNGGRLPTIGNLRGATILYADLSAGYWVYLSPTSRRYLQAVAVAGEINYETVLQDNGLVTGNGLTVSDFGRGDNTFNGTLVTHAYLGQRTSLTSGIGVPLNRGDGKEFDLAAFFMANWHF